MRRFAWLLVAACTSGEGPGDPCAAASSEVSLFYATTVPADRSERALGSALVGSLAGAMTPGDELVVRDRSGLELARGVADASGRVQLGIEAAAGDVISLGDVAYCVRDASLASTRAVLDPIDGAGSVPNDLVIAGERAVLVRSGDNAVGVFDLARGLDSGVLGVRLPEVEDLCGVHGANPWFAAPLDDRGTRVAVTAYGQRRVYLVNLDAGAVESTLEVSSSVRISPPQTLARPLDLDCDGSMETSVASFVPRTPQGIAIAGDQLVATYTSFVSARPPIFLPGTLAVWSLADPSRAPALIELGVFNPQEVRALDDHRVLVTCTGVIDPNGERVEVSSPGAVLIVDLSLGAVERRYELGEFAPGTAMILGGALWVGSVARGAVRRIDLVSGELIDELVLTPEVIDSVLRLVELPGGLIGAPSFDSDRLFVIDAATGALSPPPFFDPLVLGPGQPIPDGLQIVARRGSELYALFGPASRVRPIRLSRMLGP